MGIDLSIGGIGITDIEFWAVPMDEACEATCREGTRPLKKCIEVRVSYSIFVLLVGRLSRNRVVGRVCADECCCYGRDGFVDPE